MYRTYKQTWWAIDKTWPGGRRPQAGRRRYAGYSKRFATIEEARDYCNKYNAENDPGFRSDKMCFESVK